MDERAYSQILICGHFNYMNYCQHIIGILSYIDNLVDIYLVDLRCVFIISRVICMATLSSPNLEYGSSMH